MIQSGAMQQQCVRKIAFALCVCLQFNNLIAGYRYAQISSHSCINKMHCKFENLCLSSLQSGQISWTYFGPKKNKCPRFENVRVRSHGGRKAIIQCENKLIPKKFKFVKGVWTELEHYQRDKSFFFYSVTSNRGHVLGDDVFATYRLLQLFNMSSTDLHVVVQKSTAPDMFDMLTPHKVISPKKLPAMTCFNTVVLGLERLGYANGHNLVNPTWIRDLQHALAGFRNAALQRYNYRPNNNKLRITLIEKDMQHAKHKWGIRNMAQVQTALQMQFGNAIQIQRVNWHGMPIKIQVRLMMSTHILISSPGSDCMNAVFMPRISAMLLPDRCSRKGWEKSNEVSLWFQYIEGRYIDAWTPQKKCEFLIDLNTTDIVERVKRAIKLISNKIKFPQ